VEKPSAEVAAQYLASGDYAWNSGMFVIKASAWLKSIEQFRPDILHACEKAWASRTHDPLHDGMSFIRPNAELFAQVSSESVDYAVMEKCPGSAFPIRMVALQARWSDVGAWDAVWQVDQTDANGNVVRGDVLLNSSQGNFIHASSRSVIVETANAVLMCHKSSSQNVKNIVTQIQKSGRSETTLHRKVHRPWDWYDSVDEDERFKVKRINVKPSVALRVQNQARRAEHWNVVKGLTKVTCGREINILNENQSTYIPLGEIHRLENLGTSSMKIIELQSDSCLCEDDGVQSQDSYGRISL
jgi:mannose-1-phosphate guanylyltransferase / mannose-6-phosphate isomerase